MLKHPPPGRMTARKGFDTHDCAAASTYTNTRRDLQFQLHADLRTPPATLLQLQLPDSSAVLSQGHVAWGV
jgi:hypothetical protein